MVRTLSILDFKKCGAFCLPFIVFFILNYMVFTTSHTFYQTHNAPIVLLGNSILDRGIDKEILQQKWQVPVTKIAQDGSASAFWYLALKNVIIKQHSTKTVVVFFRDHYLTHPRFRTKGNYRSVIMRVASHQDPVFEKLVLDYDPIYYNLPGYKERQRYQRFLFSTLPQKIVSKLSQSDAHEALQDTFAVENLQVNLQTLQQRKLETEMELSMYNFEKQVHDSFLPHMIDLAKECNIQIIFVRAKRRDVQVNEEYLSPYIENLKQYFKKRHITLFDYSNSNFITKDHFADGDHLNLEGQEVFSKLVAEDLFAVIKSTHR